jgi:tetratricopeptide (TPR) repeat protein
MNDPKRKKYDEALYELIAEYEQSSRQGEALFLAEENFLQLLDYYEDEEQLEKAIEVSDRAILQHNYSIDFYLRKAYLLLRTDRAPQALDVLDEAASYAPGELEIALLRAEALAQQREYEEALEQLKPFRQLDDPQELSDLYLVEAVVYEHREDYRRMFEALKKSLHYNPRNEDALDRIWMCADYCQRQEESATLHQAIIDEDPYSYLAWHNLGHALEHLQRPEEALEAYEYAFLIKDDYVEAKLDFADLCYEQEQYARALDAYQEALEDMPGDAQISLCAGLCYQQLERYEEAQLAYRTAIKTMPDYEDAYYHLGESLGTQGKWAEAAHYFKHAITLYPEEASFHCAAAEAAFQLNDWKEAEAGYQRATALAAEESAYWLDYAWFLLATHRPAEAATLLNQATETLMDAELAYAHAACLMVAGRQKEGYQALGDALGLYYAEHPYLFEWLPPLKVDPLTNAMLDLYRS